MIKFKPYIFALLLVLSFGTQSWASPEYQIKAAFLYNFLMFVDWPQEKQADSNEPIIIGIIGQDPFEDAFEPVKDRLVNNRKVIVKRFPKFEEIQKLDESNRNQEIEILKKCDLLFICSSEEKASKDIMDLIKGCSVLTVADMQGFLEAGGIINFIMDNDRVRFAINLNAAKEAKLTIRSQLLRLAAKVIGESAAEGTKR